MRFTLSQNSRKENVMSSLNKEQHVYLAIGEKLIHLGTAKNRNCVSNANEAAVVAWSNKDDAGKGDIQLMYDSYENIAFLGGGSNHTIVFVDHKLDNI